MKTAAQPTIATATANANPPRIVINAARLATNGQSIKYMIVAPNNYFHFYNQSVTQVTKDNIVGAIQKHNPKKA